MQQSSPLVKDLKPSDQLGASPSTTSTPTEQSIGRASLAQKHNTSPERAPAVVAVPVPVPVSAQVQIGAPNSGSVGAAAQSSNPAPPVTGITPAGTAGADADLSQRATTNVQPAAISQSQARQSTCWDRALEALAASSPSVHDDLQAIAEFKKVRLPTMIRGAAVARPLPEETHFTFHQVSGP